MRDHASQHVLMDIMVIVQNKHVYNVINHVKYVLTRSSVYLVVGIYIYRIANVLVLVRKVVLQIRMYVNYVHISVRSVKVIQYVTHAHLDITKREQMYRN